MISDIINKLSPYYKKRVEKKNKGLIPSVEESSHTISYDSGAETLEPIYFFILDLMESFGLRPEKLIDNFSSSPGSGHFSELGMKASQMQQQGSKLLGDINTVLRSVLNLIYDLKEFRIRLQSYDDVKSSDKAKAEAAILSLKQLWMDKVDIQKGNSSLKAMGLGQAGFVTLIDAFLAVKDEKDADKLDLNERVKRILKPRIHEFNDWVSKSEDELRKRYEIEKTYLKSQVNSLKLYTRWAKPYLKAARELEAKEMRREPALVKTFNTIILELVILGKRKINIKGSALEGDLPSGFADDKFLKMQKRDYFSCIVIEFKFRGIPQRVSQQSHFTFGGKADVTFKSYALNSDEIKKLDYELDESDVEDALHLIDGMTKESLEQIKDEIDYFINEPEKDSKEKTKQKSGNNPFLALIGAYNKKPEKPKEKKSDEKNKEDLKDFIVKPDNWFEDEHIRPLAADTAKETLFSLFDIYKKSHGMASFT